MKASKCSQRNLLLWKGNVLLYFDEASVAFHQTHSPAISDRVPHAVKSRGVEGTATPDSGKTFKIRKRCDYKA